MKTTLGGERLGSGNKQEIAMKNYERSSHDLGYVWRSSMSSGTLVPFMSEVGLPGDSFDIDLEVDVKTLPTVGPLFGSYKVQLDVFQCPIRLYQGKLHMNMLNIGMDMSEVLLPQIEMVADYRNLSGDNSQINASSIYSYLNIRGLGRKPNGATGTVSREFNAVPYLGYWDIYKNYYANKQEERGYVVHSGVISNSFSVVDCQVNVIGGTSTSNYSIAGTPVNIDTAPQQGFPVQVEMFIDLVWNNASAPFGLPDINDVSLEIGGQTYTLTSLWPTLGVSAVHISGNDYKIICTGLFSGPASKNDWELAQTTVANTVEAGQGPPQLQEFPLANIDEMRMDILQAVKQTTPVMITSSTYAPYGLGLGQDNQDRYYKLSSQEGLGIKTYQSDLFNNWISTEWIDGTNGINEVTAVSTAGNEFTIDALNLANKVYNMLNRIAISGGTYDDWLDAVYTHERSKSVENPIYHGSLIKELAFEEVISQSDVETTSGSQPLGTLAGRGRLTSKHKGGKIKIKLDEPSYVIGIVSLTPRVDYSQGNKWDVNLKTMNDLHKPALDEIGFQDLVTDQMAWYDTEIDASGNVNYSSAGKQPAWINYMTNVNQCRGSFAQSDGIFMTLNRNYTEGVGNVGIKDLTTYIDPSKFNSIFAQTSLDSQNFWVQIRSDIFARRKMSAKVIPNL